jgi:hypothetical protein
MPSVNVSRETYEKLKALAETRHSSIDAVAEDAVEREAARAALEASDWEPDLTGVLAEIRSAVPKELTEAEIDAIADEMVAHARTKRRARGH